MTNYAEDILTKNEKGIYTLNMPKDVDSIKVSESMPREFIKGLKREFPYEAHHQTTEDILRGVTTLHKTPQTNWDKHNYHLKEAERHQKLADESIGISWIDKYERKNEKVDSIVEKKTEFTLLENIFFSAITLSGLGAIIFGIVYGIISLINLFV
ncbi:hypothetical protein ABEV81_06605 [Bacillus paranthracis]|uniref:hypothetical protein n=1 Tax=Bacillus paranthracis TaxID=2026186 RepID=UPI003F6D1BE2